MSRLAGAFYRAADRGPEWPGSHDLGLAVRRSSRAAADTPLYGDFMARSNSAKEPSICIRADGPVSIELTHLTHSAVKTRIATKKLTLSLYQRVGFSTVPQPIEIHRFSDRHWHEDYDEAIVPHPLA